MGRWLHWQKWHGIGGSSNSSITTHNARICCIGVENQGTILRTLKLAFLRNGRPILRVRQLVLISIVHLKPKRWPIFFLCRTSIGISSSSCIIIIMSSGASNDPMHHPRGRVCLGFVPSQSLKGWFHLDARQCKIRTRRHRSRRTQSVRHEAIARGHQRGGKVRHDD